MEVVRDKIYDFQEFYSGALTVSDKRVADWFLMDGYTPTLVLTALYLIIVKTLPWIMEHREPFKFKWTLFFYNCINVAINFHICSELLTASLSLNYSIICQPVSYTDDPNEMRIAKAIWWFYFSKLVEMLDTIFFILRKKNNQVSFLHVYHHASMFPIWWIGVKWVAGGQSYFGAMINSFIHVVMYTYYGVSALGPEYQKYLWWKRYLTNMQLVQFVAGIIHAVNSLYSGCDFPAWMHWALICYAFSILCFFLNFYFHQYIKSLRVKKSKKSTNGALMNGVVQNGSVYTENSELKKDQ